MNLTNNSNTSSGAARRGAARVSILICTYNRSDALKVCLESMATITADKALYEIVVINNNSTDNTNEVCQAFVAKHPDASFRYVLEARPGLWAARNRAVTEAQFELLAFIDDDQTVLPSYVDAIIQTFEDYPECMAIGGRLFPLGEDGIEPKCTSKYFNPFCNTDLGDVAKEYPKKPSFCNPTVFFPTGGTTTFRKEVFEKYGNYEVEASKKHRLGGEDIYIANKLRQNNEKILYAPSVVMYHHIPKERCEYGYLMQTGYRYGAVQRSQARSSIPDRMLKFLLSIIVGVFYVVTFRPTKGRYLIGYQYNWLRGYMKKE